MAIVNSNINYTVCYKVLLNDTENHTPVVDDKYYVKLDGESDTGFSAVYDPSGLDLEPFFTGWLVDTITTEDKTYGLMRLALPPRIEVTISVDQDGALIVARTATGL